MLQTLRYRARYYWRTACHALGFCPACWARVNWTPAGRPLCPNCKQR